MRPRHVRGRFRGHLTEEAPEATRSCPCPGPIRERGAPLAPKHGEPLRPGAERGHSLAGGHLPRVTISSPCPGWDMKLASPREKVRGTVRSLQRNNDPNPQGRAVLCGKVGGTEGPEAERRKGLVPEPAGPTRRSSDVRVPSPDQRGGGPFLSWKLEYAHKNAFSVSYLVYRGLAPGFVYCGLNVWSPDISTRKPSPSPQGGGSAGGGSGRWLGHEDPARRRHL